MSQTPPDLARPDAASRAVGEASLRLLAGAVSRKTMDQLRRTLQQSTAEFPWQVVTQAILAEPVETQRLLQQGLQAQRDWIMRGGREEPGTPVRVRAKGLLAKLCAQAIFLSLFSVVLIVALLLLKYKIPGFDIYRVLEWLYELFPSLRR
ncbi:MAG: hypothetical protein FJ265_04940 [Planctomycetes bacterium]|nr:hypothetical protein [Planctomycetota bacterium]